MNAREWIDAYAERLGIPAPTDDELRAILDLAGEAAHASQRIAGLSLEEALALARDVT
jgi:hypothetical protein